ncbi:hypothetical protein [Polyangium sp. 6x1]|uniref:hypothetical protein n=1 Tax=Polyangium sp. 6x1 TaxID=3042689 RepID=UPI0024826B14|nr:hypothetical protein [Polyangium sp. 6x1]MDI1446800.1 hypothetical protein [Polyangium sp. 6x1]
MKTNVEKWTFKHFLPHVKSNPKAPDETWEDYRDRLLDGFSNYNEQRHKKFLDQAISKLKEAESSETKSTKPVNKPKLWSNAYVWNGSRWNAATFTKDQKKSAHRFTTNDHAEQELYSRMYVPGTDTWIGFHQNEFPCMGEDSCCAYFQGVSNTIAGVVFNVVNAGHYAKDHGLEAGASGVVYIVNGQISYVRPDGAPPAPGA